MTTGIYKILNKETDKFYIGSAINVERRWSRHKHDLNNSKHANIHLQRAWIKYWSISFEFIILEICNEEDLLIHEQHYLNLTECFNLNIGYNLTPTAGSSKGVKHSEETRKRMSDAKKQMTQQTKELMRFNRLGKLHTKEQKAKIAKSLTGRPCSKETRIKIAEGNRGKVASEETRKKISAGNRNLGTKRGKYRPKYYKLLENMKAPINV